MGTVHSKTAGSSLTVWFVYVDYTDDGRPFYVGKGTYKRVHTRERNNDHWKSIRDKHGWRREVVYGTKYEDAAYEYEAFLIAEHNTFHGWGANHTAGGSCGQTGLKRSEETRWKLRESHLGKTPWNKGKPQSEEHRRKNSESRKGKKYSDRPLRWTPEMVTLLRTDREQGMTQRELAEKYKTSLAAVCNLLKHGKIWRVK